MKALNILPPKQLRPFVRGIQYMDLSPTEEGFVIPAQGRSTLILPAHTEYNLEGEIADRVALEAATVLGPHDAPIVNKTRLPIRGFTVDFTPFGAVELLGVPQGELANRGVPADRLFSSAWVRELVERVNEAPDVNAGLSAIYTLLLKAAPGSSSPKDLELVRRAVEAGLHLQGAEDRGVRRLGELLSVSTRQLNRLFHRYFGMGPRRYFLIRRIYLAMGLIAEGRAESLDRLALELGFFDYAHFSHEFKRCALATPKRFSSSRRHRETQVVAAAPREM